VSCCRATGAVSSAKQAAVPAFQKQVVLILRESDFRLLQGKHLEGLDFRGFWYTDQGTVLLVCGEDLVMSKSVL
jgi:hypothetical protein